MIDILFEFLGDIILIKVDGNNVMFANSTYGNRLATIDGLKLDRKGVIKEFPDLLNDENWRVVAIQRFKNKVSNMKTEEEIVSYVIDDLKKFGYVPKLKQKQGFRAEKI